MANKRKQGFANLENKETSRETKDLVDRLSDLPDHVILKIMSSIPIKQAVGTCILSTRWKNLFTFVSDIEIDDVLEKRPLGDSFINFVDGFLSSRKNLSVDRFRLNFGEGVNFGKITEWIQYAQRHGVKELDLSIKTTMMAKLQYLKIFLSKRLETLRLSFLPSFTLLVPTRLCLQENLKVLELSYLRFLDDESIPRLLSRCNSLEELLVCEFTNINKLSVCHPKLKRLTIIDHSEHGYEVEINTPNLVYMEYLYFNATRHSFINLNSLSEARIHIGVDINSYRDSKDIIPAIDLMRGISHVQSLHLTGGHMKTILLSPGLIPQFPNLTYLNMGRCDGGWGNMLARCPYLRTLTFDSWHCGPGNLQVAKKVPSCLGHHIKAIKLFAFEGKQIELFELIEYLLEKAEVLECLTVEIRATRRQRRMIDKEICALPKASNKCQIHII